ncbi:MAG: glutathione peroxidase [Dehalococcoidia bacterium]|nr:glutathione peroxidase [Dehalococcoidia bacterium]
MANILNYTMKRLDGKEQVLSDYGGKVLLLVNLASFCGNTPQYKELQELYQRYNAKGLEVLGFPANNFGSQEPGTDKEIVDFCTSNYGVSFPMFSKISVKGKDIHPLYAQITSEPAPLGGDVTWNFQKYLVDRKGNLAAKFPASMSPDNPGIVAKIEDLLKAP